MQHTSTDHHSHCRLPRPSLYPQGRMSYSKALLNTVLKPWNLIVFPIVPATIRGIFRIWAITRYRNLPHFRTQEQKSPNVVTLVHISLRTAVLPNWTVPKLYLFLYYSHTGCIYHLDRNVSHHPPWLNYHQMIVVRQIIIAHFWFKIDIFRRFYSRYVRHPLPKKTTYSSHNENGLLIAYWIPETLLSRLTTSLRITHNNIHIFCVKYYLMVFRTMS